MNDRLADLGDDAPAWALDTDTDADTSHLTPTASNGFASNGDIELGSMPNSSSTPAWMNQPDDFQTASSSGDEQQQAKQQQQESEEIMKRFFEHVESVKSTIDIVTNTSKRIKQLDENTKLAVSEMEEKRMSQEIKTLIQKTNADAKNAKRLLSLLREENKKYEDEKTINHSNLRKRENLVNTLTRKFIDEMKEYQNAQQAFKVNIRKKAVQQIKFVKEDATPEEVEEIMKSDGGREGLYQQSILQGGVNESIKQTYTKVAGKYQDILALEQSVSELHQMFLDFALLTEQQGELVDQIEFNVKSAADYVEDANVDVHHAIEYSKKVRKKQCLIIVIVIVVTIILLFSLGVLP
jgi:t-SNARE complex subunit (syntaxin)